MVLYLILFYQIHVGTSIVSFRSKGLTACPKRRRNLHMGAMVSQSPSNKKVDMGSHVYSCLASDVSENRSHVFSHSQRPIPALGM